MATKQVFIGIIAALAGLLFGLDLGVISGAQEFIRKDFNIGDGAIQIVVSALLWGAVFGTLISGYLSFHLGRKKTILFSALNFIVGAILCALSPGVNVLIAARFILGIAVGVASFTAPLYLSEIAPRAARGALISMYQLMITIGILGAFISNTWLASYATFNGVTGGHWRLMLGIIALPAVFMYAGVSFLPESPRWLLLKGFRDRAVGVLNRMSLGAGEIHAEITEIEESLKIRQNAWALLTKNKNFIRVIFLGVGLQIIQQLTGINVIMYYAPRILHLAGFETTNQQMWGTVLVGLVNMLATFIAIALVDRLGRKPIMYAGFVTMGMSLLAVGCLLNFGVSPNSLWSYLSVIALLVFIIGFAMSAGPIIWIICSEIYPLAGRDLGVTFSTATNWVVNAIVGQTFLTLIATLGGGNTFILYGALNVAFIVFFIFLVPETKGVSLEKIEQNLMRGFSLRKIGR
jgi:SP family galactose:H+ symporter-like MFS transporter